MSGNDREHSRVGPGSGFGARTGAGQLRPNDNDIAAAAASAAAAGGDTSGGDGEAPGSGDERQAFAPEGHLTGRPIPPQDPAAAAAAYASHGAEGSGEAHAQSAAPAATPAGAGAGGDGELELLREQNAELTSHLQRMAADFDNFRKRSRRDIEQASTSANDRLVGEMLTVLDDLERALEHVADGDSSHLVDGLRMVHGRLTTVLEAHGLAEIDATGTFDPHLHDAMMMQPDPTTEDGQILQVLQKGWRIGDRVVRHAKVIVSGS